MDASVNDLLRALLKELLPDLVRQALEDMIAAQNGGEVGAEFQEASGKGREILASRDSAHRDYRFFGTRVTPARAPDLHVVRAKGPKAHVTQWAGEIHTCPKCGHTGSVLTDFGLKQGGLRKQSWCRSCRNAR